MHGLNISGGFTLPLYRLLLGKKITLNDIEVVDPDLYRSFVWILYVMNAQFQLIAEVFSWFRAA